MTRRLGLSGIVLTLLVLAPLAAADRQTIQQGDPPTWLGIRLGGATQADQGVPVISVFTGSPADEAGLRARDVILDVDGTPVGSSRDLIRRIQEQDTGAWIPLTVLRNERERSLRVRLGTRPTDKKKMQVRQGWLGIRSIQLPESLREHFGAPAEAGVMIAEVTEAGPGMAAGFELGDVVFDVDGDPIRSPRDLVQSISGGGVGNVREYTLMRDGVEMVLEATIELPPADDRQE